MRNHSVCIIDYTVNDSSPDKDSDHQTDSKANRKGCQPLNHSFGQPPPCVMHITMHINTI
eukprot:scaffold37_cov172-Ochromonas_danica.AAC.18